MQTVRKGDRGSAVRTLQEYLQGWGCDTYADGIFGSGTDAQVKSFQESQSLVADGIVGSKTWSALESRTFVEICPDINWIVSRFTKMSYHLHADGRVNFGSIRNMISAPNKFDDWVFLLHGTAFNWTIKLFKATTDPGAYWLKNPSRSAGTAILVPGQYVDTYKIDLHGGKYEALCQRLGPVAVWRDNDKDGVADYQVGEEGIDGWYGINIHRASSTRQSTQVDKWSAGCQVMADPGDFAEFMAVAHKEADVYGNAFTWTLLEY